MNKYTAIYKDEMGNLRSMVRTDYETKKDFAFDLRANGLKVNCVLTDEQINEVKNCMIYKPYMRYIDFEFVGQCL